MGGGGGKALRKREKNQRKRRTQAARVQGKNRIEERVTFQRGGKSKAMKNDKTREGCDGVCEEYG